MKYTMTLVLILSASPMVFAARKTSNINYDSWAILYGRGKFEDGHKKTENISLQGESYKFVYSHRKSYFDTSAVLGLSNFSDNFTYSGIEGEIEHTKLTYGLHLGFWPFSWFQLHGGYAFHEIVENIKGNFSSSQKSTLETKYRLHSRKNHGLYGGADLILLQGSKAQLFLNYDYYYHNTIAAHTWQGMVGFRYHMDASKSSSSSDGPNLFQKLGDIIFPDPNKR